MPKYTLLAVAGATATLALTGGTAVASTIHGRTVTQVTCGGEVLTVTGPPGNGGNNWGAVQVDGAGHLVLESLEYVVHDDTADLTLDDEVLSHGLAHAQQGAVECVVAIEQALLGDIASQGTVLPPGTAPTDTITMSLRAVVVPRP